MRRSRLMPENSRTLIALLRGRMLDLAIVDSPFPGNEFNSLLLDTDYLTAAVPNGSPLADAGHISLAQLKKEKLILRPAGSGTRTLFEASLKKRGMSLEQFNVMMEADSVSTICCWRRCCWRCPAAPRPRGAFACCPFPI